MCKTLLFILSFWITCDPRATELSGEDPNAEHTHLMTLQHLPQDAMISIFSFVDYSSLGKSQRVCKTWHSLITEKLPIKQRYTLKLIQQFSKGFKTFEEIFLTPLPGLPLGKTALDDIIEELQEDLGVNKEQAYQALLDTHLMGPCPGMDVRIYANGSSKAEKGLLFPYIPINLFKQELEGISQQIELEMLGKGKDKGISQIFGFKNLPAQLLVKVTQIGLNDLNLSRVSRQIQRLSGLNRFSLSNNQLSSVPVEVGQLTNLKSLYLSNNQLSSLPADIRRLTNLWELYLNNNQLSNIPAEIGHLINLKQLDLANNRLNTLFIEVGQLTNLEYLYLSNNQLSSVPVEVGQLTNLKRLYLSNNQLSSLPAEIGQLTNLLGLHLYNNQLSSLPSEIGQLANLQKLFLENNQLSTIPSGIGWLTNLQWLDLTNNQLSNIPSEIGLVTNLQKLFLKNNKLNELPSEIKKALANCNIEY